MPEKTIEEKVKKTIRNQLSIPEHEYELDKKIKDDFGADTLDAIELVMALEVKFGIEISDGDADKLKTAKDIVEYIKKK